MLLTQSEIQQVLERVKVAFPNFTNWEYNNEKNGEYFGFSVWGEFEIKTEELIMPRRFFITPDKLGKLGSLVSLERGGKVTHATLVA